MIAIRRTRPIIFAAGIVAGTSISALLVALVWWRVSPPAPPPPQTIVVTVEREVPAPAPPAPAPPPAPPAPPPSKCPTIAVPDAAIGTAIKPDALSSDDPVLHVAAAAHAPQLAVLAGTAVYVSDDLGQHFRRAFGDRAIEQIAVAADGVIYARAGTALGFRVPEGDSGWREATVAACTKDGCDDRIATLGDRVVWMHDDEIAVSGNQGRSWHGIPQTDFAWSSLARGHTFEWAGSLYQVDHYTDMCGVDDYDTWRLTGDKMEHDIFHEYGSPGNPVLLTSDDTASVWTWRVKCRADDAPGLVACKDPVDRTLFTASRLPIASGGRTLATYGGALIELCGNEAHQVYRAFPFETVAAVDSAGRPLVVRGNTLAHWSPAHGWRRLYVQR